MSLLAHLAYKPRELQFGTSGRRGEVVHLTQLEIYINVLAELRYLQALPRGLGGIAPGEEVYYAHDLRPSSTAYVPEQQGRGELAQAAAAAIADAGMLPVHLGAIPTPALAHFGLTRNRASLMITGSHIPFDRNGYKANTSIGELLKEHEEPVGRMVAQVRDEIYRQPFAESAFDAWGLFKSGHRELPAPCQAAAESYLQRYREFFAGLSLHGKRLLVYQHSAVGRDLLAELLQGFGAEVVPAGRSAEFVPIDTENIDAAQIGAVQELVDEATRERGPIFAVVSTDGDSDRPLILGLDAPSGKVQFFGGDLVGMVVAEYLQADAVVVPISSNDAIDRGKLARVLEPKTRIGSPYVIAGMQSARERGRHAVCGWEANGGFLTGTEINLNGRCLSALPTRDAFLPILGVLFAAESRGLPVTGLFRELPQRFSRAALIRQFPRATALRILANFTPKTGGGEELEAIRAALRAFFPADSGFSEIAGIDYTDGVRISFRNDEVAHLRPSGNADEFRIYATADSQARADAIAEAAVEEPDGILRRMERAAASRE
ncbi:MAG: phosphomannomutase [Terriglobia bacterium]|nr:MAG: phosphomannomutase [Terriglobia bacterium]